MEPGRKVSCKSVGESLALSKYERLQGAIKVLYYNTRRLGKTMLGHKKWKPSFRSIGPKERNKKVWFRVMVLPLHMRERKMLVEIGEAYGGLITLDSIT